MKGTAAVVGGAGLLILSALSHGVIGVIVGAAIGLVGLALTGSRSERKAGIVGLVAGGLALIVSLGALPHWLLALPGIGLVVAGAVSLFGFFKNLRKRM